MCLGCGGLARARFGSQVQEFLGVLGCGRWSRGFGVFGELKGAGLGNVSGSRAEAALVRVSVCSG